MYGWQQKSTTEFDEVTSVMKDLVVSSPPLRDPSSSTTAATTATSLDPVFKRWPPILHIFAEENMSRLSGTWEEADPSRSHPASQNEGDKLKVGFWCDVCWPSPLHASHSLLDAALVQTLFARPALVVPAGQLTFGIWLPTQRGETRYLAGIFSTVFNRGRKRCDIQMIIYKLLELKVGSCSSFLPWFRSSLHSNRGFIAR